MRTYEETAARVLERRDAFYAEKKQKTIRARRRLIPAAAALAVAAGAGAFWLNRSDIVTGGGEKGVIEGNYDTGGAESLAGASGSGEGFAVYDPDKPGGYTDESGVFHEIPGAEEKEREQAVTSEEGDEYIEDTARLIPWEELSFWQQYVTCDLGEGYESTGTVLSADDLGDYISETTIRGFDPITDEKHELPAQVYEIRGISPDAAVAVSAGSGEHCIYTNFLYRPDDLGQFIDDLGLENSLGLDTPRITAYDDEGFTVYTFAAPESAETPDWLSDSIKSLLFADRSVPEFGDGELETSSEIGYIEFTANAPKLGVNNLGMWISRDGWLETNILWSRKAFFLGGDKVSEVESWLRENCTVTEERYDYDYYETGEQEDVLPDEAVIYNGAEVPE